MNTQKLDAAINALSKLVAEKPEEVPAEKIKMEEFKKFVEIYNETKPGLIHASGVTVWCDRLELEEDDLQCYIGRNYIASFNLDESMPWFITNEQMFRIRPGKVEIGDV